MNYKQKERMISLLDIGIGKEEISIIMKIDINIIIDNMIKITIASCGNPKCSNKIYVLDNRKKYCSKECRKEHGNSSKGMAYYNAKIAEYFDKNY